MTQEQAVIEALRQRNILYGDHDNAKEDSEQGRFLTSLYGRPIINNSFTAILATLRARKIVNKVGVNGWVLAHNYESELKKYEDAKRRAEDKTVAMMVRELATKEERKALDEELLRLGDEVSPYATSAEKREAGVRRRAEAMHGPKAMFTGEVEPSAWQASHSIEVRACRMVADNSPYNVLLLRSDLHGMRDNPREDGSYPLEVHAHEDVGLVLVVASKDPLYAGLDCLVQEIPEKIRREVQKRVIIGNMARKITQHVPDWFAEWHKSVMPQKEKKPYQIRRKPCQTIAQDGTLVQPSSWPTTGPTAG